MNTEIHAPQAGSERSASDAPGLPLSKRPRHLGQARCHAAPLLTLLVLLLLAGGCTSLPENVERPVSRALTDTDHTRVGRATKALTRGQPPDESGFHPLTSGLDAFVARAALADAAERSIDAQYYLLHNDLTGKLFADRLIKAADRGVRVRLLLDDMDLGGRGLGAAILDSHPNMEVRLFNPFSRRSNRALQLLTRFGSVTRRMHNKSFTVDNRAAILGGRNIGDEYFDADPRLAFKDLDVLLVGPVVSEVSDSFDGYWNSELSYPATALLERVPTEEEKREALRTLDAYVADAMDSDYLRALRDSDLANAMRSGTVRFLWGNAHVVQDEPEKIITARSRTDYHLVPQLAPYFRKIRDELLIFSPYFVPGKAGTAFLSGLSRRGVRVRVVTNSLASTDVPVVHSGYAKYRKGLLRAGVALYEIKAGPDEIEKQKRRRRGLSGSSNASLHTKAFIFDRDHVFIGSLNADPRSVHENTEIGVVLDSPELANLFARGVEEAIDRLAYRLELEADDDGTERITWHEAGEGAAGVRHTDPDTGFMQRLGVSLMGLLPVESQL